MADFATDLDNLIGQHKALGADVGEMAADLEAAAEGLNAEASDGDDEC